VGGEIGEPAVSTAGYSDGVNGGFGMSVAAAPRVYTADDLLAMPDDGVRRWVIRGELREEPTEFAEFGMTLRNRLHSSVMVTVGTLLKAWQRGLPPPHGLVYCGEVGVILPTTPLTTVGVDVVATTAEMEAAQTDETTLLEGVPLLMVEIWSPSTTKATMDEKVDEYLGVGVPTVWVIDPRWQSVTVYHPNQRPTTYYPPESLPPDPNLPGLAVTVADLFT
jgi:Uma2 family endonuclease